MSSDAAGSDRGEPPVLAAFLSALAETLSAEVAYFVPTEPGTSTARSATGATLSAVEAASLDSAAAHWLDAANGETVRMQLPDDAGGRLVDIAAVHAGSGELRGALLVSRGHDSQAHATEVDLAAALITAVVDSPPAVAARQALVDWMLATRGGRTVFAVSIDGLGAANDVLGYTAGDALLRVLAERITAWAGPHARLANTGGARHLIVRADVTGEQSARLEADRLRSLISDPIEIDGMPVSRSASVGVAIDRFGTTAPEVLIASAVRCGASARAAGGNRTEVFDDAAAEALLDRLRLGLELHGALDGGQLRLHYQPEFDLGTGRIVAVEALLRWQHPLRGLLGAESFVPDSEDSHTFPAVQRWVIDESCRQLAAWRASGVGAELALRVNVPGNLAVGGGVTALLLAAFERHRVPPEQVCVELTERRMPEDLQPLLEEAATWRGLGVHVALDDFGTGQGTLTHLLELPLDVLKIDQSFVRRIGSDPRAATLIQGVIALAAALELDVVAEGVDSADTAHRLLAMGCRRGQGNALAAAMPAEQIETLLLAQQPAEG